MKCPNCGLINPGKGSTQIVVEIPHKARAWPVFLLKLCDVNSTETGTRRRSEASLSPPKSHWAILTGTILFCEDDRVYRRWSPD